MDLETSVIHCSLLSLPESHSLYTKIHHIAFDGESLPILLHSLSSLYDNSSPSSTMSVDYFDYILWQRSWMDSMTIANQMEFWRSNLQDAPHLLNLPIDFVRPKGNTFRGSEFRANLGRGVTAKVKDLSKSLRTTEFTVYLTAFGILLGRYSNQMDVLIGTPTANRSCSEFAEIIGFFVNMLALRVDFRDSICDTPFSVSELIIRVSKILLGGLHHQVTQYLHSHITRERDTRNNSGFHTVESIHILHSPFFLRFEISWE
jgi:hypothetical protein